ncbi:MAG: mercury(II) reductase [Cellulomonas sp. 73-145]|uniref:mercury(II) reductase n=1 Tax=Cellulomonas sp. 73-145 TaxID=1895739 RepID=UPI000926FDD4|nr:mercury(II) reductase [Cellulomonas sp. 73-145]MBN9327218.1 mercury(II) reductase [Cellulomonas sp.]OJV60969.1 MAG: mercury(II) reductase [Cellulomonas sp. 73-145]
MNEEEVVDLAVVGSGGAAMAAGIQAAGSGARVVLVEHGVLGGTCVNVGCVPSKRLLAAAGARRQALTNPFAGVPTSAGPVDLAALIHQKAELTDGLRQHKYADVADAWGFRVVAGHARFADADTLLVDERPLRAHAYVLATGALPYVGDIEGIDSVECLTSTTAMELTELPESLVVIGGGYVGMEQAQLFAHLGVPVTLVGRLAPHAEPELRRVMADVFADDGIAVLAQRAAGVRHADGLVEITTSAGQTVRGHQLLVATGRRPDTSGLNLAAAGVTTDAHGFVVVDEHQATSNPRVFAAGDVTAAPQFVYVAAAAGRAAATNALTEPGDHLATVDRTGLPSVVFTRPQLASAGLTDAQARRQGYDCACRTLALADVPRALVNNDTRGAIKIVADAATGRVLGVHAVADGAGEMMLAATYAIKAGLTVDDLIDTWAPYLTMAEGLRLAAGLFRGRLPTSCCA